MLVECSTLMLIVACNPMLCPIHVYFRYSVHGKVDRGEMTTDFANFGRTGPDIGASYEQFIDRVLLTWA